MTAVCIRHRDDPVFVRETVVEIDDLLDEALRLGHAFVRVETIGDANGRLREADVTSYFEVKPDVARQLLGEGGAG